MKTKIYILCVISALMTTGCGKKAKSAPGAAAAQANQGKVVAHVQYFKGDAAGAEIDLEIDFTDPNEFLVSAQPSDPLCTKEDGEMTRAGATDLFELVSNLQLLVSSGPSPAGTDIEYIKITSVDGSVAKYHLDNVEVPAGEYYAINPSALSDFLQDLNTSLPEACP